MFKPLVSLALCSLVLASAQAQKIYQHVDENGTITFSSEPPPEGGAEEVKLDPIDMIETVKATPPSRVGVGSGEEGEQAAEEPTDYPAFRVTSPAPEEVIRNTGGVIVVRLAAGKGLQGDHRVRFYFDGAPVSITQMFSQRMADVERGTHVVHADIVDAAGQVLARTAPVTFHYQQTSVLAPANPQNPQNKARRRGN